MTDILASVSVVLGAEISGFRAAMADARKELRGLVQFSEGLKDVGKNLTAAVSVPIALMTAGAVAASAKLETLKNGLNAIATQELGKQGVTGLAAVSQAAQQTGERIKELTVIAKAPGLGLETAEQSDVRLRAVGISALQSAKSIKAFANAIATTGGGKDEFGRVTVQLAQLSAKGKVLAQDLRPIIEAAPAVATALQNLYGTVDSETISASLAKQGQSSKDFIRVLTDELAKLPPVTGGLKAIYENDMDALLVASAKVGDGIVKALNLQEVGQQVGEQIAAVGEAFENLSPGTQRVVVIFASLVAATGPLLLAVGTLGAALPAITAGFTAISSAGTLAAAGVTALISPVGLAVGAVAALAAGGYYLATANSRAYDSFVAQTDATRKLTSEVRPLLDRYDELRAKTSLTSAEQAELKAIVEKVTASMPAAGQGIDQYGNYIGLATDKARDFIKANQELDKSIALKTLPAQQAKLADLEKQYANLTRQRDEFNKTGTIKYNADDKTSYVPGTKELIEFRENLDSTNKALEAQKKVVAELGGVLNGTADGLKLFNETYRAYQERFYAANTGITQQVGLLESLKAKLKEVQEQRDKETSVAAISADNARILSLQKQIAALEGTDKASKKTGEAIARLRQELSRLTLLDNLLGDTPTQLQVLERRSDTLLKGMKTLVDAGVSPASRAFQGFAQDMVKTSQAADKLLAGLGDGGKLEFKVLAQVKLAPATLGEKYGDSIAAEFRDRPLSIPFTLAPLKSADISAALQDVSKGFREAGLSSAVFGESFNLLAARADILKSNLQKLISEGVSPLDPAFKQMVANYQNAAAASLAFDQATERNKQAADVLKSGIMEMAAGIGDAFATITSGSSDFGTILEKTLLETIGNIASQLGQILLASGLGIEALKVSLASFTGIGAIAAGLGLIAIGGLARGAASKLASSGGASAGSVSTAASSTPRSFTPTTAPGAASGPTTYKHTVIITADGRDLRGVLELETDRFGRVTGRG